MMYDPTDGTKVPQVLWGEITESQLQSTSTQQDSKPTQAAQRLSSIPSCNKLLPLEKTSFDKEFAWRSLMDKNVVESVNLMSNYLSTIDLHESQAEPAFIIADFTQDTYLRRSSIASREWTSSNINIPPSPFSSQKDARELLQKSVATLIIHKGFSVSKRSALITIVELVEQFIQKLGCELALADKGHSNLTSAVVASETALQNVGMQSGIEGILRYYQQDVLHHKVFLEAYIGRANQLRDQQST